MTDSQIYHVSSINDILKYKHLSFELPNCICALSMTPHIIMKEHTMNVVIERQKHPVMKVFQDIGKLKTKFIAALNKVSDDNVDEILTEILNLECIDVYESLNELVNVIAMKVSNDTHFVKIYAQMCAGLMKLRATDNPSVSFSMILSGKCKEIFDAYISYAKDMSQCESANVCSGMLLSINEENGKLELDKTKVINHITFIGQLYNFKIITSSGIEQCFGELFDKMKNILFSVETTVTLLKTVMPMYVEREHQMFVTHCELLKKMVPTCPFRDKYIIINFMEKNKI